MEQTRMKALRDHNMLPIIKVRNKSTCLVRGCGKVGREVASDSTGLQVEFSHQQHFTHNMFYC